VARIEKICAKRCELEKSQARLNKEKQFNRKVEINAEIRNIKHEIAAMTTATTTG